MGAERPETRDQITLMGGCSLVEHPPILDRVNTFPYEGKGDHVVVDEVKTASAVAPRRGRGTTLAVDEVPIQAPEFVDSPGNRF